MNLALLLTLLVGLFILIGTIIGRIFKDNKSILDFSISMAFGVIISLAILELFPEILESLVLPLHFKGIIYSVLGMVMGFLLLVQLDKLIPHHESSDHHHHHKNSNCLNEHLKHIGIVTSVALILHNIIEGMSLYVAATAELKVGLLLCIGIGLHNLPMGFMIESTLHNEYSLKKIIMISLIISLSTFIGGLIAYSIHTNEMVMGLLLSITFGMLIYISFIELVPQIIHIKNNKIKYIGVLSGVVILIISLIFG